MASKIMLKVRPIYAIYKQLKWIMLFAISIVIYFFIPFDYIEYKLLGALLGVFFIIRAIYGFLFYYLLVYELYEDRMVFHKGVFSKRTDYLELYRVKDYRLYQSFFMRIFRIEKLILITSDKSNPIIEIQGVVKSNVIELIRIQVEKQRKSKGVREFD